MAQWSELTRYLVGDEVELTFAELSAIVGGLPPSASRHRAWWSGNRTQVEAWRSAGYRISELVLGERVRFVRHSGSVGERAAPVRTAATHEPQSRAEAPKPDILLVTCVKSKLDRPAAAKELYLSDLFRKQLGYAERLAVPWFILSAEHGLVIPDEWLSPYERYLPKTPAGYRAVWGEWVAARLELLVGSIDRKEIEVHASADYLAAIRTPLTTRGARLHAPLDGLTMGQRLAWYGQHTTTGRLSMSSPDSPVSGGPSGALDSIVAQLSEEPRITLNALLSTGGPALDRPGLYSWWVDGAGAQNLSSGLGIPVEPGLIYAGLAGATRWPSGRRSSNTLRARIQGMHLGGRHEYSTFRRTLGAVLAEALGASDIDEEALTSWMHRHLRVVAIPTEDPDGLGRLELEVLRRLDPPLNLKGMDTSPTRTRLSALRSRHVGARRR